MSVLHIFDWRGSKRLDKKIAALITAVALVVIGTMIGLKMNESIIKKQGPGMAASELEQRAIAKTTYVTPRNETIDLYAVVENEQQFTKEMQDEWKFDGDERIFDEEWFLGDLTVYLRDREEEKGYVYFEKKDTITNGDVFFRTLEGTDDSLVTFQFYNAAKPAPLKEDATEEEKEAKELELKEHKVRDLSFHYLKVDGLSVGISSKPFLVSAREPKTDGTSKYQYAHLFPKRVFDDDGEPTGERKTNIRFLNIDVDERFVQMGTERAKERFMLVEDIESDEFTTRDLDILLDAWFEGDSIYGFPESHLDEEMIDALLEGTVDIPHLGESIDDVVAQMKEEGRLAAVFEGTDKNYLVLDDGLSYIEEDGVITNVLYQSQFQYGLAEVRELLKKKEAKEIGDEVFEFPDYIMTKEEGFMRFEKRP